PGSLLWSAGPTLFPPRHRRRCGHGRARATDRGDPRAAGYDHPTAPHRGSHPCDPAPGPAPGHRGRGPPRPLRSLRARGGLSRGVRGGAIRQGLATPRPIRPACGRALSARFERTRGFQYPDPGNALSRSGRTVLVRAEARGRRHMSAHQTPAQVRARLDHPVIDGDGHWVEFDPVFAERKRKVGGDRAADGFLAAMKTTQDALSMSLAERKRRRIAQPAFWSRQAENTLDRATAMMPRLLYERLDEFGCDFAIIYPTAGLRV